MKKKSKFTFHRTAYEVIRLIPDANDRADAYMAYCEYELFGKKANERILKIIGEAARQYCAAPLYGGDE